MDNDAILNSAFAASINYGLEKSFYDKTAAKQWNYQQKQMALENQYNRANFSLANNTDIDKMLNGERYKKQALKNAGYSAADPNGTGVSVGGSTLNPLNTPSSSGVPAVTGSGFNGSLLAASQARNLDSQSALNNIEAQYRGRILGLSADNAAIELKTKQESLQPILDQYKANIDYLVSSKQVNEAQAKYLVENASKLVEETNGIKLNNSWINRLNNQEMRLKSSEIKNNFANATRALQNGRFDKVVADLAENGIIVGADWFTQVAALSNSDHGRDLASKVVSLFTDTIESAFPSDNPSEGLGYAAANSVKNFTKGVYNFIIGDRLRDAKNKYSKRK